jgi:uncharacterized membrane protein
MTTPETKPRRWLMPAFLVSLALNLLVAGMVVGWMGNKRGPDNPDDRRAGALVGTPFVRALPPDDRRALARELQSNRTALRDNREALRARFDTLLAALRADPFDPEAVRQVLADQRNTASARQDIGEELLIARLAAMTPDARRAYADRLNQALRNVRRD